jgi:GT2 family glycosyltransferase
LRRLKYGVDVFKDDSSKTADVDTILGCSNLIKAAVFRKVGFLRAVYNVYFEETDFNVRVRRHGFRVVAVRDARVWHKNASTMNRLILRRAYLLLRNLFLFEVFNANFIQLLVFIPYYFLVHVPYFLVRGSAYVFQMRLKNILR